VDSCFCRGPQRSQRAEHFRGSAGPSGRSCERASFQGISGRSLSDLRCIKKWHVGLERMLRIYFLQQWFNLRKTSAGRKPWEEVVIFKALGYHKTMLNEFYRIAFRKKIYASLGELQKDLDQWMTEYNEERPHHGRYCFSKMPMQTSLSGPRTGLFRSWLK
jgi:hypothetical protein